MTDPISTCAPCDCTQNLFQLANSEESYRAAELTILCGILANIGGGGGGAVDSVSNTDATLTIAPTTGAVIASLNLAHNNTWTGTADFVNTVTFGNSSTLGQLIFNDGAGATSTLLFEGNSFFFGGGAGNLTYGDANIGGNAMIDGTLTVQNEAVFNNFVLANAGFESAGTFTADVDANFDGTAIFNSYFIASTLLLPNASAPSQSIFGPGYASSDSQRTVEVIGDCGSANPAVMIQLTSTDSSPDEGKWLFFVQGNSFYIQAIDDGNSFGQTAIQIDRSGNVPGTVYITQNLGLNDPGLGGYDTISASNSEFFFIDANNNAAAVQASTLGLYDFTDNGYSTISHDSGIFTFLDSAGNPAYLNGYGIFLNIIQDVGSGIQVIPSGGEEVAFLTSAAGGFVAFRHDKPISNFNRIFQITDYANSIEYFALNIDSVGQPGFDTKANNHFYLQASPGGTITNVFDFNTSTASLNLIKTGGRYQTQGFNVSDPFSAFSSGTAYTLTATQAPMVFGTLNPIVTLTNPGTYLIMGSANFTFSGATYSGGQTLTAKFTRTDNTPGDVTNATRTITFSPTTTLSGNAGDINLSVIYTTANTNDIIRWYGAVSATPSAGSVLCDSANIVAIRLY